MEKLPIALLGATGTVGQKAIALISRHPYFQLAELVASPEKAGQRYCDSIVWREYLPLPEHVGAMRLKAAYKIESRCVISALPAAAAQEIEPFLANKGHYVFTNASAHRMRPDVPLLIPEVNSSHLSMVHRQPTAGKIIANCNCATAFVALALAPLQALGEILHVSVATLQAVSGAGYPGISSLDILGNMIPYIPQEEEKIERETRKILGTADEPAPFSLTAQVHRIPIPHGHTAALQIHFRHSVSAADARQLFSSAPYTLYDKPNEPQPGRHVGPYDNGVHIGRIKSQGNILSLISMGHNLVRGAAGAALLNLETSLNFLEKS